MVAHLSLPLQLWGILIHTSLYVPPHVEATHLFVNARNVFVEERAVPRVWRKTVAPCNRQRRLLEERVGP